MSLSHLYQTNIKNKHGKKKCMIYIDLVLNQWHKKDSFLHFSDVQIQIASKNKRNVNKLLYLLQYKVDKHEVVPCLEQCPQTKHHRCCPWSKESWWLTEWEHRTPWPSAEHLRKDHKACYALKSHSILYLSSFIFAHAF